MRKFAIYKVLNTQRVTVTLGPFFVINVLQGPPIQGPRLHTGSVHRCCPVSPLLYPSFFKACGSTFFLYFLTTTPSFVLHNQFLPEPHSWNHFLSRTVLPSPLSLLRHHPFYCFISVSLSPRLKKLEPSLPSSIVFHVCMLLYLRKVPHLACEPVFYFQRHPMSLILISSCGLSTRILPFCLQSFSLLIHPPPGY